MATRFQDPLGLLILIGACDCKMKADHTQLSAWLCGQVIRSPPCFLSCS